MSNEKSTNKRNHDSYWTSLYATIMTSQKSTLTSPSEHTQHLKLAQSTASSDIFPLSFAPIMFDTTNVDENIGDIIVTNMTSDHYAIWIKCISNIHVRIHTPIAVVRARQPINIKVTFIARRPFKSPQFKISCFKVRDPNADPKELWLARHQATTPRKYSHTRAE